MKLLPFAFACAITVGGLRAALTLDVTQPDIATFRSVEKSRAALGENGDFFWDQPDNAILVGLVLWEGRYTDILSIGGLQPIWESAGKRFHGRRYGRTRGPGQTYEGKPGEALYEITARYGKVLDGMEVRFAPRGADGRLDGAAAWRTPWFAGTGGSHEARLGGDGNVTVGIYGRCGTNFDGIGFLRVRKTAAAAVPDAPLNFAEIVRRRDREMAEILDERAWREGLVMAKYSEAIEKLRASIAGPNNGADLAFLDAEIERIQTHAGGPAIPVALDAQVRELRDLYDKKSAVARRLCDAHAGELADRILHAARDFAVAQGVAIRDIPVDLVRISPPDALDRPAVMSDLAGGTSGGYFYDLSPAGHVLAGFRVRSGSGPGGRLTVRAIEPIWRAPGDRVLGRKRGEGTEREQLIEAAEGYAVGGLRLHATLRVEGIQMIFMRLGADGSLDATDNYESPWVGSSRSDFARVIEASGRAPIGVFGRSGADIDALGLIFPK